MFIGLLRATPGDDAETCVINGLGVSNRHKSHTEPKRLFPQTVKPATIIAAGMTARAERGQPTPRRFTGEAAGLDRRNFADIAAERGHGETEMRRGPPPVPTHLKLLRGNPGKQALNKHEPQPLLPDKVPDPPEFLSGYAHDEWYRIIDELYRLRLVTSVDVNCLAAYCEAFKRWRTAQELLARMAERDEATAGLLVEGKTGNSVPNPLVVIADQAARNMVRYAAEFGLTPSARSRINTGVDAAGRTASKFDGLLAG